MKKGIEVVVALASLFSLVGGTLTAVFGSRGDISPGEASVCLWAGTVLALLGLVGFFLSVQRKEKWILEGAIVFVQALAFGSILLFGP